MKPQVKVLLAFLGVVLPSLFTYLAARSDSNEAKIRAEVAYVTMQGVVKELQEASYQQAIQLAKIEGKLDASDRVRVEATLPPTLRPAVPVRPPEPKAQVKLAAPPDFKKAVQDYKAKK